MTKKAKGKDSQRESSEYYKAMIRKGCVGKPAADEICVFLVFYYFYLLPLHIRLTDDK